MNRIDRRHALSLGLIRGIAAAALLGAFSLGAQAEDAVRLGVTAGPHAQIADVVKKVAERDGLKITIVEFNDYIQPNAALDAGDLQANSFQHKPFLDAQIKARGYQLSVAGYSVTFPMGVYSKRVKTLADLPRGAKIAIPNDPSNSGRALALLAQAGVIKLKPGAGVGATVVDIAENPKGVQILQIDAAQLPRALDDAEACAINTNFAVQAKLVPTRDAIALEDARGPYANLIAVRTADQGKPWVAKLVRAYQSPEVKKLVESSFGGSMVPAF